MKGYTYQKYYLKIIFLFFKINFIHTKDKKKIIDELKKLFKFKYITKKIIII